MLDIQRSTASVADDYRENLQAIVQDAEGGANKDEIAKRHRELIIASAILMFVAGMQAGGVSGDEMTDAEKALIAAWTAEQLSHVDDFAAAAILAGDNPAEQDKINARLELWVAALLALGGQGLMSAGGDKIGIWRLGETELHCRTCNGLHNKRHRLSWYKARGLIPREPGSTTLECKGYQCLCGIYDEQGNLLVPAHRAVRFDPNQPRDPEGKWTETGIDGESVSPVEFDDDQKAAYINNEIEIGGLEYDRVVKANKYQAKFWQSKDGRLKRVYLNVDRNDITHQLYKGDWSSQQGKEWHGYGTISFGYFQYNQENKLMYYKQENGVRINGKSFNQEHLVETVKEMFRRYGGRI